MVGDLTSHCPNVVVSDYGRLTITEDTADVLGVTAAYRAMTALGNSAHDDARQGKPSHALTHSANAFVGSADAILLFLFTNVVFRGQRQVRMRQGNVRRPRRPPGPRGQYPA